MIGGLSGEKDRWTTTVADLTIQLSLVIGDSLIAAGAISYSGSFTSVYREEMERIWRDALEENDIAQIRSMPKLSTLNSHEATLSIGTTTYYTVISTSTTNS